MRCIIVLAALLAVIYAQTAVTNEQASPEKTLVPAASSDFGTSSESSEVAETQTRNKRAPIIGKALVGGALLGAGALGVGALGAGALGAGLLGAGAVGAGLYKAKYLAGGYGYGYGYDYPYPYHQHTHYHNYPPSYHSHYHSYPSYHYSYPQYHHYSYGPSYW